jgi:hypothetical protein
LLAICRAPAAKPKNAVFLKRRGLWFYCCFATDRRQASSYAFGRSELMVRSKLLILAAGRHAAPLLLILAARRRSKLARDLPGTGSKT